MACLSAGCKAVALARLITSTFMAGSPWLALAQTPAPSATLDTRFVYDALGRVVEVTDPANGKTRIAYDGRDRPIQVTDPRGLVTQYVRNGFGEVTQVVSPDTGTTNMTYDEAGNLKTRIDNRGVLTRYSYDALNRLSEAVYSRDGQTQALSWGWDMTGPDYTNGIGRLGRTDHPHGSARWKHDPLGRVTQATQTVNASSGANSAAVTSVVQYGYTLGRLTSITYPSGRQVGIGYAGRRIGALTLAQSAGGNTQPLLNDIQWQPFGTWRGWTWGMTGTVGDGALKQERYFDQGGRLVRHRLGENYRDLGYDGAMRITGFTHLNATSGSPQPALDQVFSYDANSRLTLIATANSTWSIAYDANGNRTSASLNGEPGTYTTEATSNRLTAISNPVRSFGYDSAGSTTMDGARYTATYDLRGQLQTITTAAGTATYTYDVDGRRVRKVTSAGPSSTVIFVYDLDGQLLGEYDQSGNAIREYVWLEHTPVAMFTPDPVNPSGAPLVFFIHTDHLDAPRIVVDRNNQMRWRWLAEPFGTTAPETNPSGLGVFTQNLRFPGQYADAESGLFYNYFRSYDPSRGYTQSDPIGLAGGSLSTYTYVDGNPLSGTDPTGLSEEVLPALLPVALPTATAICSGGPVACALAAAGIGGYAGGAVLYPYIEQPLGAAIDMCMAAVSDTPTADECAAEWRRGENVCVEWMRELRSSISERRRRQLSRLAGGSFAVCVGGQVAQACGGTRVERAPKPRRKRFL